MCLAVPLKIISIEGKSGIGEYNGIKQKVKLDFVNDVKVNSYVMVHAGFAMQIVDEETYKATMEIFNEIESVHDVNA